MSGSNIEQDRHDEWGSRAMLTITSANELGQTGDCQSRRQSIRSLAGSRDSKVDMNPSRREKCRQN